MDSSAKTKLLRKTKRLIWRGALRNKKIVLFGASVFSKEVQIFLEKFGYTVSAIVDNDIRKVGKRFLGMTVNTPEEVLLPYDEKKYILIYSPGFFREITAQLEGMGYRKNRQSFTLNFRVNDSLFMFGYISMHKLMGLYWYRMITKGHPADCRIYIAPYTGTGDIYLIGLFFHTYIERHGITDYVFVVVTNACRKVAEMFDIKNIVVISSQTGNDMISLKLATGRYSNITVLNDGWMGDPLQWFRGYNGLNFTKMFRYFVFGFDDSVAPVLPPKKDNSREIDALFDKHGLIKGKTVVISPYSSTLFDLPEGALEAIVNHCKKQGFIPVTNCAGDEKPVANTEAVFFPLNIAADFMDAAGYFVGVRSGLCDIISSSTCKKVIIYDKDGLFYKTTHFEYFSLKKMGLCDDALEIEYHDSKKNECLYEIMEALQ
jgi:hypothetical protein